MCLQCATLLIIITVLGLTVLLSGTLEQLPAPIVMLRDVNFKASTGNSNILVRFVYVLG